jgi:succinate dehydrogenase/fumarate reductase flavoprotein subunit
MLTVASIATEGAIQRKESRGVHFRTDFLDVAAPEHSLMRPTMVDECTIEADASLQSAIQEKSA